jgi:Zn finger protein HypA/HybF involved in hydrogenase expression
MKLPHPSAPKAKIADKMNLVDPDFLIKSGNFFCQDCMHDFDAPELGLLCPVCGGERISDAEDPSAVGQ